MATKKTKAKIDPRPGASKKSGTSYLKAAEMRVPFSQARKPASTTFAELVMARTAVNVPLKSLKATQAHVDRAKIDSLRAHPNSELPFVVKKNGQLQIMDGHHRLTVAKLSGAQTARVNLIDLDAGGKRGKLADLRAKKDSALQLRDKLKQSNLNVVAQMSAKHAKQLQTQITTIKKDYQSRAEKAQATKAGKAKGQDIAVKALASGRDALRAHARELGIAGRSKMNMATLRSEVAKAAARTGSKLGAIAMIAAPLTAAALAYDATKSSAAAAGQSGKEATVSGAKAAAVAGGTTLATTGAVVGGLSLASKALPFIGKVAGPLAIPFAAVGAKQGLEKHGPAGALFGAFGLDDLAAWGKHKAESVLLPSPGERKEAIVPRSSRFATANTAYQAMQDTKSNTTTLKGWQNPSNQAAIIKNRQDKAALR